MQIRVFEPRLITLLFIGRKHTFHLALCQPTPSFCLWILQSRLVYNGPCSRAESGKNMKHVLSYHLQTEIMIVKEDDYQENVKRAKELQCAVSSHVYDCECHFKCFNVDWFSNPPPGCASAGALLQGLHSHEITVKVSSRFRVLSLQL